MSSTKIYIYISFELDGFCLVIYLRREREREREEEMYGFGWHYWEQPRQKSMWRVSENKRFKASQYYFLPHMCFGP